MMNINTALVAGSVTCRRVEDLHEWVSAQRSQGLSACSSHSTHNRLSRSPHCGLTWTLATRSATA